MAVTEDAWRIQVLQHRVESIRTALGYAEISDDVRTVLLQHLDRAEAELRHASAALHGSAGGTVA